MQSVVSRSSRICVPPKHHLSCGKAGGNAHAPKHAHWSEYLSVRNGYAWHAERKVGCDRSVLQQSNRLCASSGCSGRWLGKARPVYCADCRLGASGSDRAADAGRCPRQSCAARCRSSSGPWRTWKICVSVSRARDARRRCASVAADHSKAWVRVPCCVCRNLNSNKFEGTIGAWLGSMFKLTVL